MIAITLSEPLSAQSLPKIVQSSAPCEALQSQARLLTKEDHILTEEERATAMSLNRAIGVQLKPYWRSPFRTSGTEIVTVLSWILKEDGSLSGDPQIVCQKGLTDGNRKMAYKHAQRAINAVKKAAPFVLPSEYYKFWKYIENFQFDATSRSK